MTPRVRRGAASAGSEGCDREMPSPVEGGGSLARGEGGAELASAGRDGMAAGSAAGARDALDAESAGGAELGSGVEAGRGTLEGGAGVEAALALSAARTESGPELTEAGRGTGVAGRAEGGAGVEAAPVLSAARTESGPGLTEAGRGTGVRRGTGGGALSGRGGEGRTEVGRSLDTRLGGSEAEKIERSTFTALPDDGAGGSRPEIPTARELEGLSTGVGTSDRFESPSAPDGGRGADSGGRRSAGIDGSFGSLGDTSGLEASYSASPAHSASMESVAGALEGARQGRDDVGSELEGPLLPG